jgi:hypothetical protein
MFSDEVKYQLDFAKKAKVFSFIGHWTEMTFYENFNELKDLINNSKSIDKISIVSFHEPFLKQHSQRVIDYMNTTDVEYYLSAATSTPADKFFNPLVNIFFWRDTRIRYNVKWSSQDTLRLFDKNLYEIPSEKTNKGILSIRKTSRKREFLDSIIDKENFEGIYRFINYPRGNPQKTIDLSDEIVSQYPTTFELIQEYKKSYVSFISETCLENGTMSPLTEKTLIAFLTKTIPIVLGGKHYVKELKDMGFYVWNDEFGFDDGDILESQTYLKIYKFNNCINHYNSMSIDDIRDFYNSNIDKIENNYQILSKILFDNAK